MLNIPKIEEDILDFWKKNKIFEKSLKKKPGPQSQGRGRDFVFYDGPPTANGRPGIHHVLGRAFKDLIPRYKTMQGYHVERKAGWDTHGLPVELEVEKELGLQNKKDIENYGIEKFNKKCKESAWKYKEDWEKLTERIAFWIDMENPYITYDNDYIESLWWIIKKIYEKDLLYKGHKVVPQCPRCGTALSSHEVAQGYKNIEEKTVTIKFKLKKDQKIGDWIIDDDTYILAWTTTPWTLPGNIALAVAKDINYSILELRTSLRRGISSGEMMLTPGYYIIATDRIPKLIKKGDYFTDKPQNIKGQDLIGLEYEPLFPGIIKGNEKNAQNAFKIYPADFVSTEEGTGVVHTAVMYGIEDYKLGEKVGLPKVHTVNLDGTFNKLVPQWKGKFVKDVEKEIVEDLIKRNLLFGTENYIHDYPFCWRCESPLIYYAKDSWYFAMSKLRDELIKNNSKINWVPEHIKEGRFGEWLREVKDWAISRERYWGTPIPIWVCRECGKMKVIGSRKELGVDEKFDLHRPYVDEIKLKCKCGGEMKRIPEVMDCWFDSGSMPFAQYHYPFENKQLIDKGKQYPADFIAEGLDQTRGWFYTLLAVSTLLDKGPSYKNVISHGLVLDKEGKKMSKSLGNVVDIWEMIDKYGVDVIRWYFYTINQPGEAKRFDEEGLKESTKTFITLLNVVNFYKMFSSEEVGDLEKKDLTNVLDRWINSKLNSLIKEVTEKLDKYDIFTAGRKIEEFITDLSVWYVRRSRERFKNGDEKAVRVLRYVLLNLIRLMAPFTPFVAEHIYKEISSLAKVSEDRESVHLCDWSKVNKRLIDKDLEEKMEKVREICSLALQKRAEAGIKVRQPLQQLTINNKQLTKELLDLIKDEVNVKEVKLSARGGSALGGKEGVVLDTRITKELEEEGLIREFIRQIQALRKEKGLTPKDKIRVYFGLSAAVPTKVGTKVGDSKLKDIIEKHKDQIKKQVIAERVEYKEGELEIDKI